eukprot:gene7132-11445_t
MSQEYQTFRNTFNLAKVSLKNKYSELYLKYQSVKFKVDATNSTADGKQIFINNQNNWKSNIKQCILSLKPDSPKKSSEHIVFFATAKFDSYPDIDVILKFQFDGEVIEDFSKDHGQSILDNFKKLNGYTLKNLKKTLEMTGFF